MNLDIQAAGSRSGKKAEKKVRDGSSAAKKSGNSDLPRICFLIARPRSGTTVFSKMLGTHPRVACVGEIFNESNERSYFQFLKRQVATDADSLLPGNSHKTFMKYVETCRRSAEAKKANCKVVVLDVKYDQSHLLCEPWWKIGQLPRLFFLMREQRWRVIDIHRNDVVGLCISNQVAMQTKIYHSNALPEGEKQSARIRINPNQVLREIRATQQVYQMIETHFAARREYKKLNYENMFDSDGNFSEQTVGEVSEFLGVQNHFDRAPRLQKLLSDDVLDHVENASELRELLESAELRETLEA
ncbi:MAG TPA: sulfotransferase [Rhizomicrobium sp.]|nr:sulfotransferase [Rhizomicrobium sp.]